MSNFWMSTNKGKGVAESIVAVSDNLNNKRQFTGQLLIMGHLPKPCQIVSADARGLVVSVEENFAEPSQQNGALLRVKDRVDVLATPPGGDALHLTTELAVLEGAQLKLNFLNSSEPPVKQFLSLYQHSSGRGANHQVLLQELRALTRQHLQSIMTGFVDRADEALFAAARDAENNVEQQNYFEALNQLRDNSARLTKEFIMPIIGGLDHSRDDDEVEGQTIKGFEDLSVVDEQVYEDWLTVNALIKSVSESHRQTLDCLLKRYSIFMELALSEESLPVGIARLCHAFHDVIDKMSLARSVQATLYCCFEEDVIGGAGKLYEALNDCFIHHGILPELEAGQGVVVAQESAQSHRQVTNNVSSIDDNNAVLNPANEAIEQASPGPGQAPAAYDNVVPLYEAAKHTRELYGTVKSMLALRRSSIDLPVQSGSAAISNYPVLAEQQLLHTLDDNKVELDAMSAVAAGVSLKNWIAANCRQGGMPMQLADAVGDYVDLVENIFDNMVSENGVPELAKPLLKQLEVPYLKVILKDDGFLEDAAHPARKLLNQLAQLSSFTDISPRAIERKLESVSQQLTQQNCTLDSDVFNVVSNDVGKLIKNQQSAHARNADRVAKNYDGQEKLEQAHHAVKGALSKRLLGRSVSQLVLSLLEAGWRDLLIHAYLKGGRSGIQWREYLGTIDQLLRWLSEEEAEASVDEGVLDRASEAETFIDLIARELDAGFPGQYQHLAVIKQLRSILCRDSIDVQQLDCIELNPKDNWYGIELDGNRKFRRIEKDESLQRWYPRAEQLKVGDWIGSVKAGRNEDMRLVWHSHDKGHFVFVNRLGQKSADLQLWELAEKMKQGWQVIDASTDWESVDDGLYGMLQKIYDELDYQRSHDELTGLINRKEFENIINNTLYSTKQDVSEHTLLHVNLDQFNVVNEYCGVVAGDQLLKEVSRLLQDIIPSSSVVARLGGNEFSLLLEHHNREQGYKCAEEIRQMIQEYRFDWQDKNYSLTASIGLVVMDHLSENFVSLYKDMNSACNLAKEEGRNRIVCAAEDEEQRQKRDDVFSWVARINRALDDDKLKLRCQLIQPLDESSETGSHYEILLGVTDEDEDVLVPPDKFIAAAERYNRMHDVDRWVVRNTLDWMESNPQKMAAIEKISINLSGSTINDDYFLEFLNEQMNSRSISFDKICFEVTETATISNISKAADFILEVKKMGCEFALDDFGTGMSSYEYLKRLPVDYLKIDGCFIKDLANSPFDYAVVKSINEIGHFMGKKTIAEYVETDEIAVLLREIGVDYAQGYGVEKPRLLSEI